MSTLTPTRPLISRVARRLAAPLSGFRDRGELARLRRLTAHTPRHTPGSIRLAGLDIAYTDLMSLYIEYKDIFSHRIYHFDSAPGTPGDAAPRVLDGGGCIGVSAMYFKSIYPTARVTTFEPDEQIANVLEHNLKANGFEDVEVVRAGLSDRDGSVSFAADGVDGGRIAADGASTIRVTRLSPYLSEPIDFLKLNIEGQELPVLREAGDRLRHVKRLVLEYHGFPGQPQRLGEILSLLDAQGFRYLVHDFDALTCATSKPPFRLRGKAWFCLVYASREER